MKATPYFDGTHPQGVVGVTRTTVPSAGADLVIEALEEFAPHGSRNCFCGDTVADYIRSSSAVTAR